MKKAFIITSLLLLTPIVSCSNSYSTPECVSVYSISTSKDHNRTSYYLQVYEVYEEISGFNTWSNPRFDVRFKFYYDEEITLSHLKTSVKEIYHCKGDGYYTFAFFVYDYTDLSTTVPLKFYLTQDIVIYYGCQG